MVKAMDTIAESELLVGSGRTRLGAYNRLYYACHHLAVALLWLTGVVPRRHQTIIRRFHNEWVHKRGFPKTYWKLLKDLYSAREKADYGEYVPSLPQDLDKLVVRVHRFAKAVSKRLPRISTERVLQLLASENEFIRDFSFDICCPKSYFHHTRFTAWCPKGRVTDAWLAKLLNSNFATSSETPGVEDLSSYVLGLNSRVNQHLCAGIVRRFLPNGLTITARDAGRRLGSNLCWRR